MGLDLALGGVVLLMAIRGWFKGFILQAIRLTGLVLCVYAANPVRDQLKPRVIGYLPTIRPDLIERGLWWASAVIAYVVLVGLTSLAVKLYRRQPYGLEEKRRGDQFVGSLLGAAKGVVTAAFLVAAFETYGLDHIKNLPPRAQEQVETSYAMRWNAQYRPVARVWASPPVQHFVRHVQEHGGLSGPPEKSEKGEKAEKKPEPPASDPVQTASRAPKLQWPAPAMPGSPSINVDPEVADAIQEIQQELSRGRNSR